MLLKQKYGPVALVAGASEGIGAAFSTFFAEEGLDLILVARRREPLEQLAVSLKKSFDVEVTCICCDLSDMNSINAVKDVIGGREISVLVYNAAMSYIGPFTHVSLELHQQIANANILMPMTMVRIFGTPMLERGRGALILMASLAGLQGSGFLATYASSKAFIRILAESLWYEWKGSGVDVIACCAGATATPNFINTRPGKTGLFAPRVQEPEEVVRECMKRLGKDPSIITGTGNKIASFIMQRMLTRKRAINIMGDSTRGMYRL